MKPIDPITTRPTVGACVFCGGRPLSDEHMWPRWTHPYIKKETGKYPTLEATALRDRTEFRIGRKSGTIYDRQVCCVCETCNCGWMSRLEDAVKPIALPLILGRKSRISPREQSTLAGWCSLKAMIGEYESSEISTQAQRTRLKSIGRPPRDGFEVWIGDVDAMAAGASWTFHPFLVTEEADGLGEPATSHNSCISTQVVGRLLIHVVRSDVAGVVRRCRPPGGLVERLRRIWPASASAISWPPPGLSPRQVDSVESETFRRMHGRAMRKMEQAQRQAASDDETVNAPVDVKG